MSGDLISRQAVLSVLVFSDGTKDMLCKDMRKVLDVINAIPSAEPEIITIEEVANQLGCATIQSALYWFEFLKTLDLLGFAIIRKEIR